MVRIQAHTIRKVIPQLTARAFFAEPTHDIAPVIVCVVLTGTQSDDATKRLTALAVSAQKPSIGRSFTILLPMVFTIFHPPVSVPALMARYAHIITHIGGSGLFVRLADNRRLTIIPMVFCASFPP